MTIPTKRQTVQLQVNLGEVSNSVECPAATTALTRAELHAALNAHIPNQVPTTSTGIHVIVSSRYNEIPMSYYVLHINGNFPLYPVRAMNGNMYRIVGHGRPTSTQAPT